jgi:hypothetical protein
MGSLFGCSFTSVTMETFKASIIGVVRQHWQDVGCIQWSPVGNTAEN